MSPIEGCQGPTGVFWVYVGRVFHVFMIWARKVFGCETRPLLVRCLININEALATCQAPDELLGQWLQETSGLILTEVTVGREAWCYHLDLCDIADSAAL